MQDTASFILEKTAPVFNRQGYVGTSLSDLTKATGLTKGAIYCNFESKEDLAVQVFERNIRFAIFPLFTIIAEQNSSVEKLLAVTSYHRSYYDLVHNLGGCPMLRAGVDSKFNNPLLFEAAEKVSEKLLAGLTKIIAEGIRRREFNQNANPKEGASLILSMIEGSTALAFTHNDESFITNAMNFIDQNIINNMKA